MLDYLVFSSLRSFFGWVLIFFISLIALAFAFVQIEEQPFSYLVANFFSYVFRPKIRLWDKKHRAEKTVQFKNKKTEKAGPILRRPEAVKSSLEALAGVLDTHGWSPERYKKELSEYGIQSDLGERIKSSTEAKKELNLGRTEEAEVDLLHKTNA
jgi:hypothetical protein